MRTTMRILLPVLVMVLACGTVSGEEPSQAARRTVAEVIGAGPAQSLATLAGGDFDLAYICEMYRLHGNISALASLGIEQSTDKRLKDFAGKVRYEQTKLNEKLAAVNRQTGRPGLVADYSKVQSISAALAAYTEEQFSIVFATMLIGVLDQARQAAALGEQKATLPELRSQARVIAGSAEKEIEALSRWMRTGFLSAQEERVHRQRDIFQPASH